MLSYVMGAGHGGEETSDTSPSTSPRVVQHTLQDDEESLILHAKHKESDKCASSVTRNYTNSEMREEYVGDTTEMASLDMEIMNTNQNWQRGRSFQLNEHQRNMLLSPPVVAIACAAVLANVSSDLRIQGGTAGKMVTTTQISN